MIDFFKPVDVAWMRMEQCLFKPFALGKWFALGFTAWLASFLEGGGFFGGGNDGGSPESTFTQGTNHEMSEGFSSVLAWGLPIWLFLIAVGFLVIIAFVLVFVWLGCRGQFMFLDNVLRDRADIQRPWTEFKRHGNSLFFLTGGMVLAGAGLIFLFIALGLASFWTNFSAQTAPNFPLLIPWLVGLGLGVLGLIVVSIYFFFLREFGVPVMYRTGCSALQASARVWKLGCARPLDFLVYFLLRIVMGILFVMLACLAGCLTCCVGFIPYLHSVLTLPLAVFRLSYTLECLSHITGEDFWAPSPPPTPPLEGI